MSYNITDTTIKKLLDGRVIYDEYKPILTNDENSPQKQNLIFELGKLGYSSLTNFIFENNIHNVIEFDQTYEPAPTRDLTTTIPKIEDFCFAGKSCTDRGIPSCIMAGEAAVTCFLREPIVKDVLPHNKSLFNSKYIQLAKQVGIVDFTNLFIPHPLILISCKKISPDFLAPKYCKGGARKFKECRFDIFWGMEKFFDWAELHHVIRENIINAS